MRVLTAAESRQVDRVAIDVFKIPGLVLMEHAARAVADAVRELLPPGGRVVVVAGAGNNGGDGYAAARLLRVAGIDTHVVALGEASGEDAVRNAEIWERIGGVTEPFGGAVLADVIVDAIFGTGLTRAPAGVYAQAIEAINREGAPVVAVDLPSGLSADTGRPLGPCVRATATVTFGALKRGLVLHPGAELAGSVRVAPISLPAEAFTGLGPEVELLDEEEVRALVPVRKAEGHKGTFGHVLVVAGSFGKSGAAAMCGRGALVGGAGLVSVATRPEVVPQVLAHAMELMAAPLPAGGVLGVSDLESLVEAAAGKDALLIGPGIPRGPETGELIDRLLARIGCPAVLDADALNARPDDLTGTVITPHPGEMSRLCGLSVQEIQQDRIGVAQRFAGQHGCTVVLKGARTVIAGDDGRVAICATGNPGMGTAGTGDVLGGLIAALIAQGLAPFDAARAGVHVHGLAGDLRASVRGQAGLTASDVLEGISEVWASWKR